MCVNHEGCQSCAAGNYLDKVTGMELSQCLGCPVGCTSCLNRNECTLCEENFVLANMVQNGTFLQICIPNGAMRIGLGLIGLVVTLVAMFF
jgi:hypothetical protein